MSTVIAINRFKIYDYQNNVMLNLGKDDEIILGKIMHILPDDTDRVLFNMDRIVIVLQDQEEIYIYCNTTDETNSYCKHEFRNNYDLEKIIDINYTCNFLETKEDIIEFLLDESIYRKENMIIRAIKYNDYNEKELSKYIKGIPIENKKNILGYTNYKTIDDEYTLFYNKEDFER